MTSYAQKSTLEFQQELESYTTIDDVVSLQQKLLAEIHTLGQRRSTALNIEEYERYMKWNSERIRKLKTFSDLAADHTLKLARQSSGQ